MALDPLKAMATSRAKESAEAVCVDRCSRSVLVRLSHAVQPTCSVSSSDIAELAAMLGASAAIVGWCMGAIFTWLGRDRRRPRCCGESLERVVSCRLCAHWSGYASQEPVKKSTWEPWCGKPLNPAVDDQLIVACQINGVRDNPYLPGTLIHIPCGTVRWTLFLCSLGVLSRLHGHVGCLAGLHPRFWRHASALQMPTRVNDELQFGP